VCDVSYLPAVSAMMLKSAEDVLRRFVIEMMSLTRCADKEMRGFLLERVVDGKRVVDWWRVLLMDNDERSAT
jgi:hypothetical protein